MNNGVRATRTTAQMCVTPPPIFSQSSERPQRNSVLENGLYFDNGISQPLLIVGRGKVSFDDKTTSGAAAV